MKSYCSLGLMSVTSMDGVDASIIQSDGVNKFKAILDSYFEYSKAIYRNLTQLRDKIKSSKDLKKFAKEVKVTYPIALDIGADIFALFADRNSGVTRNIIIDQNGKIAFLTRLFDPVEYIEMKKVIHSLLLNQFLEEKQNLVAQKQILKELKNKRKSENQSSINKIEKRLLLIESKLNLKKRRLLYAQKLL